MELVKLGQLFIIDNGTNLELNKLKKNTKGINFVSRTQKNNGVSARVEKIDGIEPHRAGSITVSLGGSVLESFIQEEDFYTSYHMAILTPIVKMTDNEKLFYCMCIKENKYRYNFGRQANKTLDKIMVPSYNSIPKWVNRVKIINMSNLSDKFNIEQLDEQNIEYDLFDFSELFEYENEQKYDALKTVNLVSALTKNNGVKEKVITDTYIQGNKLSISTNGIYTGTAFYQEEDFILQDSISVSLKNKELNKYIGMYLITVINYENFRFDYGRKSGKSRLNRLKLRLPINDYGNPDYDYMERYIKTLEFSKYI